MLESQVLKYSIWFLGVLTLIGNFMVVVLRAFKKDLGKVNSCLLMNLACADFLMGIYLMIIASKDHTWDGVYYKHDSSWRASGLCIAAGVISTLSGEVSVLILTFVAIDRMICIVFSFRFPRISMRTATIIMIAVWCFGAVIAVVPLLRDDYFYDYNDDVHFFGRSAVCLPMLFHTEKSPGWEYSVSVFIVLNGLCFFYILVAYILMYRTVVKSSKAVRSTNAQRQTTLAKRMMFIILTDFLCWVPVIVISVLSLTGNFHDPKNQVYAWIAVFVLPINSAINPLLYTFSTSYVLDRISNRGRPNEGRPNEGRPNQGRPNQGRPNEGIAPPAVRATPPQIIIWGKHCLKLQYIL